MRRIMLFVSSYIPLYVLLVIKNFLERCTDTGRFVLTWNKIKNAHYFDEINDYAVVFLVIMSIVAFFYLKSLTKKDCDVHYYEISHIEDQTGNIYFNYISVYLLSCLGLTLNSIVDVFVLLFLMFLVGYIYISNHMTYMNPVLQFMGYKIYEGDIKSKSTGKTFHSIMVVGNDTIITRGETYKGSGKEDFVFIAEKSAD